MEPGTASGMPMDVLGFLEEGAFPVVPEDASIANHIYLLLTTAKDEYPPDPEYGCELWDHQFSTVQASAVWMDRMAQHMKEMIERYEGRLTDVHVKAEVDQAEFKQKQGNHVAGRLKRRLRITLHARLARTNETFHFMDTMMVAPFSHD
ncbi:MAG: GPW/gp25 family protein [Flavobacteriales bacterium]